MPNAPHTNECLRHTSPRIYRELKEKTRSRSNVWLERLVALLKSKNNFSEYDVENIRASFTSLGISLDLDHNTISHPLRNFLEEHSIEPTAIPTIRHFPVNKKYICLANRQLDCRISRHSQAKNADAICNSMSSWIACANNDAVLGYLSESPKDSEQMLTQIAFWEIIKNNIDSIFFAVQVMNAVSCSVAVQMSNELHEIAQIIHNSYLSALIGSPTTLSPNFVAWVNDSIPPILEEIKKFAENNPNMQIFRFAKEVDNYFTLAHAAELVTNSPKFRRSDAIVIPLMGGLELAFTLKWLQSNSSQQIREIMDGMLPNSAQVQKASKPIILVLPKVKYLDGTPEQIVMRLDNQNMKTLEQAISDGIDHVMLLDDSVGRGRIFAMLEKWITDIFAAHELKKPHFDFSATAISIKPPLPSNVFVSPECMVDELNPITVTPHLMHSSGFMLYHTLLLKIITNEYLC